MTTLKVGIASYEEMKARTMAVARGERRGAAIPRDSHAQQAARVQLDLPLTMSRKGR
jgi:predicted transcriptional regulator